MAPVLKRVLNALLSRHAELNRWLTQADDSEVASRLGNHPPEAVHREIRELETAIEKCKRDELGRCRVCHDTVEDHLLEMDFAAAVCLSHFSAEERSRLENELELSRKVQRALLPRSAPTVDGWQMTAYSQPASIVGGDYFDFLRFGDGALAVIIADVMGKGMPASMIMAKLQASLRIIVPESRSPKDVVERLNRVFHHNISLTKFVSLFVGHLDTVTGELVYVNAGHNPPFVMNQNGDTVLLSPTGPAIGLVEEPEFAVQRTVIGKGETLALYTDGIVESRSASGEEFGNKRLEEVIRLNHALPVGELVQQIRAQVRDFVGRSIREDDSTLIVCRRLRG